MSKYVITKTMNVFVTTEESTEVEFYLTHDYNYATEINSAKLFDSQKEADILIQKLRLDGFASVAVPEVTLGEK